MRSAPVDHPAVFDGEQRSVCRRSGINYRTFDRTVHNHSLIDFRQYRRSFLSGTGYPCIGYNDMIQFPFHTDDPKQRRIAVIIQDAIFFLLRHTRVAAHKRLLLTKNIADNIGPQINILYLYKMSGRKLCHPFQMSGSRNFIWLFPRSGSPQKRTFRITLIIMPVSRRIAVCYYLQTKFSLISVALIILSVPCDRTMLSHRYCSQISGPDCLAFSADQIQHRMFGRPILTQRNLHRIFAADKITAVADFRMYPGYVYRYLFHPNTNTNSFGIRTVCTGNISNSHFFWRNIERNFIASPASPASAANSRILDFIADNRIFRKGKRHRRFSFNRYRRYARTIGLVYNYMTFIFCITNLCRNGRFAFADTCDYSCRTYSCNLLITCRPFHALCSPCHFQRRLSADTNDCI